MYYGNCNTYNHDGKLRVFTCNECGSYDLSDPRESESDHRDVLRFTCNKCGINPYHHWLHVSDAIRVTNKNKDKLLEIYCKHRGEDIKDTKWRQELLDLFNKEEQEDIENGDYHN